MAQPQSARAIIRWKKKQQQKNNNNNNKRKENEDLELYGTKKRG